MYFLTEGTYAFCRFCPRAKNSTFVANVNWIFTREDVKLFDTFVVKIAEEYGQKNRRRICSHGGLFILPFSH